MARKNRRKRFNSYMRPYRYDDLGRFFYQHGYPNLGISKHSDGLYFDGPLSEDWKDTYTYTRSLRELTYGQWLEEVEFKIEDNKRKQT